MIENFKNLKHGNGTKVIVGMSGGVDSTVAAYVMKEMGYDVTGVTMSIWDGTIPIEDTGKSGCFGPGEKEDLRVAKLVCEKIGIKHVVIDLAEEYKKTVLKYFCDEYLEGKTPNPCVICNAKMKFGYLIDKAKEHGLEFEYFVTGHYANVAKDENSGRFYLQKAYDKFKDQTYFISHLKQVQLSKLIFPLGELPKEKVKDIARHIGLDFVADKDESQDFIETDDYSVLFKEGEVRPGPIVDLQGKKLGEHKGIVHYTIGQRKGLGIGGVNGNLDPVYVLGIDSCRNTVIVGPEKYLLSDSFVVKAPNWISVDAISSEMPAKVKIRQQHKEQEAMLIPQSSVGEHKASRAILVKFKDPQRAITPGQTAVFYDADERVLGGGIISRPE